ncbi:PhoH family protein [Haliovirga abyssi]|uniref:PhoH-like protein n=1 Tax=Haliovirga abyssi TaxID=2996794 RepID=A0AAU9D7B3_9FUSO|nr:PhoH family protein [Haliovirga abyssi]BDU50463.1 phosphate starvation protein PhoH [Haliovirga abyssi]
MEIIIKKHSFLQYFFGINDNILNEIHSNFETILKVYENRLLIEGKNKDIIYKYILTLQELYDKDILLSETEILDGILNLIENREFSYDYLLKKDRILAFRGKRLRPKTRNQTIYLDMISKNDIIFGVGPAGTGKTYLAVAMAIKNLIEKKVEKIILTRPAVEAGESLGFLPGDLKEKIDPYLRPLYDALYEMVGAEKTYKYIEKEIIEIAPLAYMRGRTLNNSFIILDEAQNTTKTQMKMFLTRFGFNSKAIITGDITQIDLEKKSDSGLIQAIRILRNISKIGIMEFEKKDVVRNKVVKEIIGAYEKMGEKI